MTVIVPGAYRVLRTRLDELLIVLVRLQWFDVDYSAC